MILHEVEIKHDSRNDVFKLKPCFDWHRGNKYSDLKAIKSYLADSDEFTYFVGGGDLMDSIITQDIRRYMKHTDATNGDAIIDEQIDELYNLLKPYEGRILGIGLGNHEDDLIKFGTHPSRRLAHRLNTVSLGFEWMVRLKFNRHGNVKTLLVRGHHGWGGGTRTQGGSLTKYSKDTAFWEADIFLYGHDHMRQSDKIDRLYWPNQGGLIAKPKHVFLCGTFLKTLSDTDIPTYSERKGYPPKSIGGVTISITPGTHGWMGIESDV